MRFFLGNSPTKTLGWHTKKTHNYLCMMEILHICILGYLRYVPGVCWNLNCQLLVFRRKQTFESSCLLKGLWPLCCDFKILEIIKPHRKSVSCWATISEDKNPYLFYILVVKKMFCQPLLPRYLKNTPHVLPWFFFFSPNKSSRAYQEAPFFPSLSRHFLQGITAPYRINNRDFSPVTWEQLAVTSWIFPGDPRVSGSKSSQGSSYVGLII